MRLLPQFSTVVFLLLAVYLSTEADIISFFEAHLEIPFIGPFFFIAALATAVALAPLAALPLIPLATALFGPFLTAVLSILGWTIGGIMAFMVARHAGRPLIEQVVSLEKLKKYEKHIPPDMEFVTLLLLRMVIPVDILSYAVGILSSISFRSYVFATGIGVIPFAFIFAYGSRAAAAGEYLTLIALVLLALLIFFFVWRIIRRRRGVSEKG